MSVIDEVLAANEIYSRTHELRKLTPRPERKLAVLTCMDTRLSIRTLGLKTGDAHVIRNAGGIVTEDVIRSLLVSHFLLGTEEIMVINHTDCGLMHTSEEGLRTRIQTRAGTAAVAPASFHTFQNVEENVRHQMQKLRAHPWIPESVTVRGFVYDVTNGRLREIKDAWRLVRRHLPSLHPLGRLMS
jgi:carbonic anhydrase